jgi:hypothetical protein
MDPATKEIKKYLYKDLPSVLSMLGADGKKWLKTNWMWRGLRREKSVETEEFEARTKVTMAET